jgi:hypothetical protein
MPATFGTRSRRWPRRAAVVTGVVLAASLVMASEARALVDGTDRQLTATPSLDNISHFSMQPAISRNTRTGEFLVVFRGIVNGAAGQDVFGQRLDASGAPVGPRLTLGPPTAVDADPGQRFPDPRVAYSETSDRWLVVFAVDDQRSGRPNNKFEVFTRSVSGSGEVAALPTQPVSDTTGNTANDSAAHPDVAWNPDRDEFLVAWDTDVLSGSDDRIWVRRTTPMGTPIGSPVDVGATPAAHGGVLPTSSPSLAYDTTADRWLVTWFADPHTANVDFEQEVFGRFLDGLAGGLGAAFRVTATGLETDVNANAGSALYANPGPAARAVHSPRTNAFAVAHWGDPGAAAGLAAGKAEVFLQRIAADGTRPAGGLVRLSETGADGDGARNAVSPDIALHPASGEMLVTWLDDDPALGLADGETEISGQRILPDLVAAGGDFRIGQTGVDGVLAGSVFAPAVTASPAGYAVAWAGRPGYFKLEVLGDHVRLPVLSLPATATVGESAGTLALPVTVSDADPEGVPIAASGVAAGGTASLGADFLAPGPLGLPALATAGSLAVPILDDALVEGPETFSVSLSDPVGAILGSATTAVTITDDDVAPAPGAPGAPGPPAPTPSPDTRAPAKLQVARAQVRGGRLDLLGTITARATGSLRVTYRAAGRTTRFTTRIGSGGRVRIDRALSGAQRRRPTGIVELAYAGNARVRPDEVRLRAARGRALLTRAVTRIRSRRLEVSGTVSRRARGLVRIRLAYLDTDGDVTELQYRARIAIPKAGGAGRWQIRPLLPARAAAVGGQVDIQFTGYEPGRIRGEQVSKQVDP